MNKTNKIRRLFATPLRIVCFLNWLKSIVVIPYGIIYAKLISEMVSAAISGEVDNVLKLSVFTVSFAVIYRLVLSGLEMLTTLKDMKANQRCKMILYSAVLRSPLNILFSETNGEILENLTDDLNIVTSATKHLFPGLVTALLTTIVYSFFIGVQSVIIALAFILISLLQILPPIIIRKYMQINYDINREVEAKVTDFTVAGYEGMATIKLFSLEHWYLNRMKKIHAEAQNAGRKAELTGAAQSSMNSLVSNLLQYGMYLVVGIAVFTGQSTIEVGIQAIALSGGLFGSVKAVFDCIPQFSLVQKSEERLSKWFSGNGSVYNCINTGTYAMSAQNVSYSYDSAMVLNNLNLKIKNGELALLKGKNGAGKTTLIRVITGLLPLQEGIITFNGDSSSFWGDTLFYMPQEDIVFNMTTAELCEMLRRKPSISDFEEWGLTESLVKSSNISDLSGGERKKVYLAIAFSSNPQMLILDEPSNSLDSDAKETLCRKLIERSDTTLVISHDDRFDGLMCNIYRLEEGEIKIEK